MSTALAAIAKFLDAFPGWFYAMVIAGLMVLGVTVFAMQNATLAAQKTQIASLQHAAEKDRADRATLLANHALEVAAMRAAHSTRQQEITDGYTQQISDAEKEHARELALVRLRSDNRVRDAAEQAAARDRAAAQSNPASCGDLADRNAALYELLAEGHRVVAGQHELAVEGRAIVRRRDAEVAALKNVIENDRAAICGSN